MPKPPAKLSRERIQSAALKMIEKKGLHEFSLRDLAKALKIQPMSLYHYFPSRLALLNAVLDQVIGEMRVAPRDLPWQDRIRFASGEWMRVARAYPRFYAFLSTHRLNTPVALGLLHELLSLFTVAGLPPRRAAYYFRSVGYLLLGAGLDETAGYENGASATEPLSEEEEAGRFPLIAELGQYFTPEHQPEIFKTGLEALIAAIEAETAPSSAARSRRS